MFSGLIQMTTSLCSFLRQTGDTILIQTLFVWISAYVWSDGLIVRQLESPTLLHKIEEKRRLMLFESLCSICISMFPLLSLKNEGNSRQIIYVAYKTVGLLSCRTLYSCRTSDRIPCGYMILDLGKKFYEIKTQFLCFILQDLLRVFVKKIFYMNLLQIHKINFGLINLRIMKLSRILLLPLFSS